MLLTPELTTSLFTRSTGDYVFARWGRPIVPVIFGVTDETLPTIKGAIEAIVAIAGHKMAETDPELGANFMVFFFSDWDELLAVPSMDQMIPDLAGTVARLKSADAGQYRAFRFDDNGAIQACFSFVRMNEAQADLPAEVIALGVAVHGVLLWSDTAFADVSALAELPDNAGTIVRPEIANVIRAAYEPVLPASDRDPAHALRLYARAVHAA
ncbi:hypothetical protein ACP2AV_03955 [Aliiroseovarius sp. PTFE2010]|uniref:hypothetical protein n=1 Tax=Aliiroseovarius sp. PTFE2010 TaxID=3417190 RepID=UPI003CE7B3F0